MKYVAHSLQKLATRPTPIKNKESLKFRERIQSNIYGLCICLLSSRNVIFVKNVIQIIKQRTQFSYYTIKRIRLDNIDGFTSQYSMTIVW